MHVYSCGMSDIENRRVFIALKKNPRFNRSKTFLFYVKLPTHVNSKWLDVHVIMIELKSF